MELTSCARRSDRRPRPCEHSDYFVLSLQFRKVAALLRALGQALDAVSVSGQTLYVRAIGERAESSSPPKLLLRMISWVFDHMGNQTGGFMKCTHPVVSAN